MIQDSENRFIMTEPSEQPTGTVYAFWLITDESSLFQFVHSLNCVADVSVAASNRAVIGIRDECDPYKAWDYIRKEVEGELKTVRLDPIWEQVIIGL
jgi:hypothetical protein